jgi:hypothetical protein
MKSRLSLKTLIGRGGASAPTIPPDLNITIRRQHRRSLMMRPVPGGFEVYIPRWMRPDNPKVTEFIQSGLQKLGTEPPPIPVEQTSRENGLTAEAGELPQYDAQMGFLFQP